MNSKDILCLGLLRSLGAFVEGCAGDRPVLCLLTYAYTSESIEARI